MVHKELPIKAGYVNGISFGDPESDVPVYEVRIPVDATQSLQIIAQGVQKAIRAACPRGAEACPLVADVHIGDGAALKTPLDCASPDCTL